VSARVVLLACLGGSLLACDQSSSTDALPSGSGPAKTEHSLVISRLGQGYVRSTPAGLVCGTECEFDFPEGTVVQLVAEPVSSSRFLGWSGECAGTTPTCELTVHGPRVVIAQFFGGAGDAGVAIDAALPDSGVPRPDSGPVDGDAGLVDGDVGSAMDAGDLDAGVDDAADAGS